MKGLDELEKRRRTAPDSQKGGSGFFARLKSRQIPTAAEASASQLAAGYDWSETLDLWTIGDEIVRLMGDANIELGYNPGDPMVTITPSLHLLRALAAEARDLRRRWDRSAPLAELESVRLAVARALEAIGRFHDEQVALLQRITPRSFEDGSCQRIWPDIARRIQALIDGIDLPLSGILQAMKALQTAIVDAVRA